MARTRFLKAAEIEKVYAAAVQRISDAVRHPRAEKRLLELAQFEYSLSVFYWTLHNLRKTRQTKLLKQLLRVDEAKVAASTRQDQRLTAADAKDFSEFAVMIEQYILGRDIPAFHPSRFRALLHRLERRQKVTPKRFEPRFVNAFREREKARKNGKVITQAKLAAKFMPDAYQRNLDSATRCMGKALARIEAEEKRLELAGFIKSPYRE